MQTQSHAPRLAPPGAGLPLLQKWIARYYLLPRYWNRTTWDDAQALFDREGEKILELATPLNFTQLTTPILVSGIRGIEDSSRYWSVAMAMEHLIIVGDQIAHGVVEISHGRNAPSPADIVAVKPKGGLDSVCHTFREFLRRFRDKMQNECGDRSSPVRFEHPWFGGLTAHQWHCLAAIHQSTHRRQIQAILAGMR